MFRVAQTEQACFDAAYELGNWSPQYYSAGVLQGTQVRAIEAVMKTTDKE